LPESDVVLFNGLCAIGELKSAQAKRTGRPTDELIQLYALECFLDLQTIAAISLEDGMEFDSNGATAETIREEDSYSGIRVTLGGTLSRAVIRIHVDPCCKKKAAMPRPNRCCAGR